MLTKSIEPSNMSSNGSAFLAPTMTPLALAIEPADPVFVKDLPSTFATTEVLVFMHSSVCQFPSTMSRLRSMALRPRLAAGLPFSRMVEKGPNA